MGSAPPQVSIGVVVCAYTEDRWDDLVSGVAAVQRQRQPGDELVVVIDHNDALAQRARAALPEDVQVVTSAGVPGLSDARNTGVSATRADVVAFLDDDALPAPGWLSGFREVFADPDVAAVGGAIRPRWDGGTAPRWFPPEFGWVIGCDYRGLPGDGEAIRNPIGASMAVRRELVGAVGGFSPLVGRVGTRPVGNEETELGIRIRQRDPDARIVRATGPVVHHRVPRSRQTVRYFLSRCYHEGISKAALTGSVGSHDGLSAERAYVTRVLPSGVGLHMRDALRGEPAGLARAALVPLGLAATGTGFVVGRARPPAAAAAAP